MMSLNKRYSRNYRSSLSFYIVVALLTMITGTLVLSAISTALLMKNVYNGAIDRANTEDAQFITVFPLDDDKISELENKYDLDLERMVSFDAEIDGYTLRLLGENERVNLTELTEGSDLLSDDEMLISEQFAQYHDLSIGDTVNVNGADMKIVGYMVRTDYLAMFKETSDSFTNLDTFGIAVAKRSAVEGMDGNKEYYSVKFRKDNSVDFRREINGDHTILSYISRTSNMRINSALNQSKLIFSVAIVIAPVLYLVVILLIALMLKRKLKGEQKQIGTLVALGYRKKEIKRHYALYSLIPAVAGGIIGVIGGFFATYPFSAFYFGYFEHLPYTVKPSVLTAVILLLSPAVLYTLVSYRTVGKMLKKSPIDMLRQNEKERGGSANVFVGRNMSFRTKYKLRTVIRHKGRSAVIIVGMIISTVCVLLGWSIKNSVDSLVDSSIEYIPYEYCYFLNTTDFEIPENAEGLLVNTYEQPEHTVNFSMWGYEEDTKLLSFKTVDGEAMEYGKYYITNAASKAYGVGKGGELTFRDPITTEEFKIKISGVIDDNTNTVVYTSAENVAAFMDYGSSDRNTMISSEKLDPDEDKVMAVMSRTDAKDSVASVTDMYYSICYLIMVVGIILGILSMYLLTGMIIEENTVNISMLKILGYRKKEIGSLILTSNTLLVLIGFIIGVPVTIAVSKATFASSVETVGMYFPMALRPLSYVIAFAAVIFSYAVSIALSYRKLGKVEMTESLKRNNE